MSGSSCLNSLATTSPLVTFWNVFASRGDELRTDRHFFAHVKDEFVLETIRTSTMRVIHITVKTEETQRLRIKFVLYCPT